MDSERAVRQCTSMVNDTSGVYSSREISYNLAKAAGSSGSDTPACCPDKSEAASSPLSLMGSSSTTYSTQLELSTLVGIAL